jgi:hypothetical protein
MHIIADRLKEIKAATIAKENNKYFQVLLRKRNINGVSKIT